jgi:hypothetical protein
VFWRHGLVCGRKQWLFLGADPASKEILLRLPAIIAAPSNSQAKLDCTFNVPTVICLFLPYLILFFSVPCFHPPTWGKPSLILQLETSTTNTDWLPAILPTQVAPSCGADFINYWGKAQRSVIHCSFFPFFFFFLVKPSFTGPPLLDFQLLTSLSLLTSW